MAKSKRGNMVPTTKSTKKTARKTANRTLLPVDAARKRLYDVQFDRYRTARSQETTGWDERFEALGEILDGELYLAGGFKSERDFLKAEVDDLDERSVRRSIRVARNFDPEDEEKYGITKLDLLLDYLAAAGGAPVPPVKIRLDKQMVTVRREKKDRKISFAEVTAAELTAAARTAKGMKGTTQKSASPVVKALRGALRKAKLSSVAVSTKGERLTLSNIESPEVNRLGKALASVRLPPG